MELKGVGHDIFIHSFHRQLLSTHHVLRTVLGFYSQDKDHCKGNKSFSVFLHKAMLLQFILRCNKSLQSLMAYNNNNLLLLTIRSVGWVVSLLISSGLSHSRSCIQLETLLG